MPSSVSNATNLSVNFLIILVFLTDNPKRYQFRAGDRLGAIRPAPFPGPGVAWEETVTAFEGFPNDKFAIIGVFQQPDIGSHESPAHRYFKS